jgi:hypothetical protein
MAGVRGHARSARPRPHRAVTVPAIRAAGPPGGPPRRQSRSPTHPCRLLRGRMPVCPAPAGVGCARHGLRATRVRGDGAVRDGARLRDAHRPGAAAEPRAAGTVRHRGRAQFVHLADLDHRGPGAGRLRLPARRPDGLRDRCGAARTRSGDGARPAGRWRGRGAGGRVPGVAVTPLRTPFRALEAPGARGDLARPLRRPVRWRDRAASGLCSGRAARGADRSRLVADGPGRGGGRGAGPPPSGCFRSPVASVTGCSAG